MEKTKKQEMVEMDKEEERVDKKKKKTKTKTKDFNRKYPRKRRKPSENNLSNRTVQ